MSGVRFSSFVRAGAGFDLEPRELRGGGRESVRENGAQLCDGGREGETRRNEGTHRIFRRSAMLSSAKAAARTLGVASSSPRRGDDEGNGVTGADLIGLRSPRALWDRNMHDSARGGAGFRQFKLNHQPWALPFLGLGAVRRLPRFLRPP